MRKEIGKIIIVLFMVLSIGQTLRAQEVENEFQSRLNVELKYKPLKKLSFSFVPELRLDESFAADVYVFNGGVKYKLLDFLSVGGIYRFAINPRDTKSTEYLNRFSLSAVAKKEINRFTPAFRLRYTNDADDEVDDKDFLRYKGIVEYNIKNSKLSPFVAAEVFHELQSNSLHKMRYTAGLDYKLSKRNHLELSYKFDYYQTEYKNKHIVTLGYKFKF